MLFNQSRYPVQTRFYIDIRKSIKAKLKTNEGEYHLDIS